jgi:hypothetical protein
VNVYAIRDVKVGYGAPVLRENDALVMRDFSLLVNSPGVHHDCPKDFSLYRIGQYDEEVGALYPEIPVVLVCEAMDVLKKE